VTLRRANLTTLGLRSDGRLQPARQSRRSGSSPCGSHRTVKPFEDSCTHRPSHHQRRQPSLAARTAHTLFPICSSHRSTDPTFIREPPELPAHYDRKDDRFMSYHRRAQPISSSYTSALPRRHHHASKAPEPHTTIQRQRYRPWLAHHAEELVVLVGTLCGLGDYLVTGHCLPPGHLPRLALKSASQAVSSPQTILRAGRFPQRGGKQR
jgi:hypothetical protein